MSSFNQILTLTAAGLIVIGILLPMLPKVKAQWRKPRTRGDPGQLTSTSIASDYTPTKETLEYLLAISQACPKAPGDFKFKQASAGKTPFEASLAWNAELQGPPEESAT